MDIESAALNNGFATNIWFKDSRGVRQGCPLSPMCYPDSRNAVKQNKIKHNHKRNQNFGSEIKLSQFTDDTNLFCADVASAEQALETINAFGNFSGLVLNVHVE